MMDVGLDDRKAARLPHRVFADQTKRHNAVGPRVGVDLSLVAARSIGLRTARPRRGFAYCRARVERSLGMVVSHTQVPWLPKCLSCLCKAKGLSQST